MFIASCALQIGVDVRSVKNQVQRNVIRCRILDIDLESRRELVKSISRVFKNL